MYYHQLTIKDAKDKLTSHFTVEEVACRCCGLVKVAPGFMTHLEILRVAFGFPMTLSSACRCPAHNEAEGGRYGSFHLTDNPKWDVDGTCAVDVLWGSWDRQLKEKLIETATRLGWSVGTANSFCHLDKRSTYIDYPRVDFTYQGFLGL